MIAMDTNTDSKNLAALPKPASAGPAVTPMTAIQTSHRLLARPPKHSLDPWESGGQAGLNMPWDPQQKSHIRRPSNYRMDGPPLARTKPPRIILI